MSQRGSFRPLMLYFPHQASNSEHKHLLLLIFKGRKKAPKDKHISANKQGMCALNFCSSLAIIGVLFKKKHGSKGEE